VDYALSRIAGRGTGEVLLCTELPLAPPAAHLLEARKTVFVDCLDLTPGHVIVQGRLRVQWVYQACVAEEMPPPRPPGAAVVGITVGPVHSLTADIAFQMCIAVDGARPGMGCRVVDAFVTADASHAPGPEAVVDRSLVLVSLEVIEPEVRRAARTSVVAAPTSGQVVKRGVRPIDRQGL
jgi:hypothetical protein